MPQKLLSLVLILGVFFSGGCWDSRELEDQAFIMSICIDQGQHCKYLWTFRIAIPRQMAGGQGGGGAGAGAGGKTSTVVSIEANTLFDALNLLNTFVDRRANLMHAKIIIIGEQLAKKGSLPLTALIRYREVRRTLYVIVARGLARDILLKNKPSLEINPAKFFEVLAMNGSYTGLAPAIQLHDFLVETQSSDRESIVMLVGISKGGKPSQVKKTPRDSAPYLPGEVPREGDTPIEVIGSAIFRKGKMVGTLTGTENRSFEMVSNIFHRGFISFPDPKVSDKFISLDLRLGAPTSITTKIHSDGTSQIDVKVSLEGDILTIQSQVDYTRIDKLNILEKAAEEIIKQDIQKTVKKTQALDADIFKFGSSLKKKFATSQQWEAFKWEEEHYPSVKINTHVKLSIRRIGLNFNPPIIE